MIYVVGEKVLITLASWFYGSDGTAYRAIFGTVKGLKNAIDALDLVPDRPPVFLEIGRITVTLSQIEATIKTDTCEFGKVTDYTVGDGKYLEYERKCLIYNADGE
jgi:hypothetical protein